MIIRCPKCDKEYSIPDDKIPSKDAKAKCNTCGQSIIIKGTGGEANRQPEKYLCPKCGQKGFDSKECSECGVVFLKFQKMKEAASKSALVDQKTEPSKGKSTRKITIVALLIFIASVVLLTGLYKKLESKNYNKKEILVAGSNVLDVDMKVFDMTLGEPFPENVMECNYGEIDNNTCYKLMRGDNLVNGFVNIRLPSSPIYMKWDGLHCRIYDGKIEGFRFDLNGRKYESEALEALTEKWGKPTSLESVSLTNGFGAKFSSFEASWHLGDLRAFFSPSTDSKRYVMIYTSYGIKRQNYEFKQHMQNKIKL